MKILLTTRRAYHEPRNPIAILDLAAYFRQQGHQVDAFFLDQVQQRGFNSKSYDLIGLSVLQALDEQTPIQDARFLKKKFRIPVVVGGKWTHTLTKAQEEILQESGIEIYRAPGEHYFGEGEIDFSHYPSWNVADFYTLGDVRPEVMTTRGCPYHCHFCHNTERKISFFSAKRSADHVELLFRLGVKNIFFIDDVFTLNPNHMASLFSELQARNIEIQHRNEFFTHILHIREETLQWIKKYQPYRISVGVESGDDGMLLRMGKGFDTKTAFQKLQWLYEETRLPIGALFMIGFPGETEESLTRTLQFIKKIRPFAGSWVSYYQPVRGTVGYQMAQEQISEVKAGRRNTQISYVPPNLTAKILFKYHYRMMDFSPPGSIRSRLIHFLIDWLPCGLLFPIRRWRQNRRLKHLIENPPIEMFAMEHV